MIIFFFILFLLSKNLKINILFIVFLKKEKSQECTFKFSNKIKMHGVESDLIVAVTGYFSILF